MIEEIMSGVEGHWMQVPDVNAWVGAFLVVGGLALIKHAFRKKVGMAHMGVSLGLLAVTALAYLVETNVLMGVVVMMTVAHLFSSYQKARYMKFLAYKAAQAAASDPPK